MSVIWTETDRLGYPDGAPKAPIMLNFGNIAGFTNQLPALGQWNSQSILTDYAGNPTSIPAGKVAWVWVAGELILTPGTGPQCNPDDQITLALEKTNWGMGPTNNCAQCLASAARQPFGFLVPVVNDEFSYSIGCGNTGLTPPTYPLGYAAPQTAMLAFPTGNAYGINASIQAYGYDSGSAALIAAALAQANAAVTAANAAASVANAAAAAAQAAIAQIGTPVYVPPSTDAEKLALLASLIGALTRSPLPTPN